MATLNINPFLSRSTATPLLPRLSLAVLTPRKLFLTTEIMKSFLWDLKVELYRCGGRLQMESLAIRASTGTLFWCYTKNGGSFLVFPSYGRTTETRCGDILQTFVFNKKNHNIQSRSQCNGQLAKYIYDNLLMVRGCTLTTSSKYAY